MGVINLDKREKVINALLACYSADVKWCQAREKGLCNYNVAHCRMALFKDAAELLKAQPLTIEPKRIDLADETKAELDKMDAVDALGNIADICIDWDGYRTADGLGGLINEVWAYARYCADRLQKEQEPIVPVQGADDQDEDVFCCGICGAVVGETFLGPPGECEVRDNYCPNCGRKVKWK